MFGKTILATCLFLLASVPVQGAVAAKRAPDATVGRVAPRSVVSGTNTCYFSCPGAYQTAGGETATLGTGNGGGTCNYETTTGATSTCTYSGTGANTGGPAECPDAADDAGCSPTGTPPPIAGSFRRSIYAPRAVSPLSRSQKIIRSRQYKPKKVAKRHA